MWSASVSVALACGWGVVCAAAQVSAQSVQADVPPSAVELATAVEAVGLSVDTAEFSLPDEHWFLTVDDPSALPRPGILLDPVPATDLARDNSGNASPMVPLPPALVVGPIGIVLTAWATYRARRHWRG